MEVAWPDLGREGGLAQPIMATQRQPQRALPLGEAT